MAVEKGNFQKYKKKNLDEIELSDSEVEDLVSTEQSQKKCQCWR